MRIAAGVHFYVPNRMAGSETALHAALLALKEAGHEVAVFCTDSGGGYAVDDIPVYESSAASLFSDLQAWSPDVVTGHHDQWATVAKYGGRKSIPTVLYVHNTYHTSQIQLYRSPTLVVFNTHHAKEALISHAPNVVLHPPVAPEAHKTTPGSAVTLVNVSANKGERTFYTAASMLPDVEFLGVEGGHGVQRFEFWPNVTFQQQTANMRDDVWAKTRILLVPSEFESYGMVGVEALASGIPVIAHPTPGLQESLGPGGIFIDRDDHEAWARKIQELQDGRRWKAASRRALKRSDEIEAERPAELARFVEAVEMAYKFGRTDFAQEWRINERCHS